ncbi:kinase-like protein [Sarocladium strictum]
METLSIALQDYKVELYDGSTRRLITHAIYDAHLSPSEPPRLETWEREKKPVAEGGQGKVYVQRCFAADTIRAVKVIRHKDNTGRRRYLQELETMIRFSHQRYSRLFVRMLGWYAFRKDICIIMEYLPQGDIHTFLRQRSALEENDARTVISQILQGISVMHKAGFAHRDVKPQNILIQRSPNPTSLSSWWVKLADFGISKDVNTTITNGTGAIGTWDYMAPELINYRQGTTAVDYMAGDMWSAGATTLYLMTKLQGAHRQGFKSPEEITQCLPSGTKTSPNARDFLYRALAPDPGFRLDAAGGLTHPWISDLVPSVKGSIIPETDNGKAVLLHETDVQRQRRAYLEAAYWGKLDVVMSCLGDGVDVETRGFGEQSALYIAASQGHEDIVRALLDADAAIDSPNDTNFTPLHAAIHSKHQEMALLLIQQGANVQAADNQGGTPLHHAIIRNLLQVVTQLQASEADVDAVGLHGLTVLHIAAMAGNDEIVLQLPLEKANMEAVVPPSDWLESNFLHLPPLVRAKLSPLHLAILYKHPKVVQCLLNSGSHREVMAAVASTVASALLYCALIAGDPACFKTLLRHIPYRNKKPLWENLLAAAVRSRQTEFAYMLQDTLANYAANAEGLKLIEVPSASDTTKRCELNDELSGVWLRNTRGLFSRKLHIGTPDNPKLFRIAWEALAHGAGRRFFVHASSSAAGPSPALVAGDVPLNKVINGLFQVNPDLMEVQEREPVDVLRMGKTEVGGVWFRFSSGEHGRGQSVGEREDLLPDIDESEDYEWTVSTASHEHLKRYDLFQLQKRDASGTIRHNERREPREHSGGVVATLILNARSLRTRAFSLLITPNEKRVSTDVQNDSGRDALSWERTLRILITALMIWFRHVHEKVSLEDKMDELVGLTTAPS